jgi:hypothetical protein
MTRLRQIFSGVHYLLAGIVLLWVSLALAQDQPFAVASVHFEQNATDGDVEVVFEVKGGDEGLAKLTVTAPDGRTVVECTSPDASTLGIRQYRFESPEKGEVENIKSAYPEGMYTFSAVSTSGVKFDGKSALSHKLPATVDFLQPEAEAEDVDIEDLKFTWSPVKNVTFYMIEISQEELDINVTAKIPGSLAEFRAPEGFLLPGKEYTLGIGTVSEDGNISFVETAFTTAGEED